MANLDPRLQDYKGNTALHEAGIRGDPQILKFLFGADLSLSDLNRQNHEGETPLFLAASAGHFAVTELLLDQGLCHLSTAQRLVLGCSKLGCINLGPKILAQLNSFQVAEIVVNENTHLKNENVHSHHYIRSLKLTFLGNLI